MSLGPAEIIGWLLSASTLLVTCKMNFGKDAKLKRQLDYVTARLPARKLQRELREKGLSEDERIEAKREADYDLEVLLGEASDNLRVLSRQGLGERTYIIGLARWRRLLLAYKPTLDKARYLDRVAYLALLGVCCWNRWSLSVLFLPVLY